MRLHLWRYCKAIVVTNKKVLDLKSEIASKHLLTRSTNEIRIGLNNFVNATPTPIPKEEFTIDDLYLTVETRRKYTSNTKRPVPVPVTSLYYDTEKELFVPNASSNEIIPVTRTNPIEKIDQVAEYKAIKVFRLQRFYHDKLGHNVNTTTRTEPVMVFYIMK